MRAGLTRSNRRRAVLAAVASGALIIGMPTSVAADDDRDGGHDDDKGHHHADDDRHHDDDGDKDGRHHRHGDHHKGKLRVLVDGLEGPRGLAAFGHGKLVVSEIDGTFSLIVSKHRHGHHGDDHKHHKHVKIMELGSVEAGFIAPAVDVGKNKTVWIVTPEGEPDTAAMKLYKWRHGWDEPKEIADIGEYQREEDPDPFDLEDNPGQSNPFDVVALKDGSVLVADAGGNDLLRVEKDGDIETVAMLKPRMVKVPDNLPDMPPGEGEPPADAPPPLKPGDMVKAEAVATSVTVGDDGYWYVGELRGFPATPGTSQIWRIKPGSVDAVCDPEKPDEGDCQRFADGLTSIVDLAADDDDNIYALSLSKMSWLAMEMEVEGAEIGGLFKISHHGEKIRELAKDKLIMPGGVAVDDHDHVYVTGPVFGPGSVFKVGGH